MSIQNFRNETEPPASIPVEPRGVSVRPVAVIDIGTTSIRMEVAQISSDGTVHSLQRLFQAVNLGRDTFTKGILRRATIEECVRILKSYRTILSEHQITQPDQVRVVATSAVREAENRLTFLDRIYTATGFHVEPIEEPDVIRMTYLGLQPFLQAEPALAAGTTMILEIGGGSTELLVVQGENVLSSQTYRLGSVRMRESLESLRSARLSSREIMADQIGHIIDQIRQHADADGVDQIVALGGDMRFAAAQLLHEWTPDVLGRLPLRDLDRFTESFLAMSRDQIVRKYRLSYADAETLGPSLLANVMIAKAYRLEQVLVTRFSLRDGLLEDMAARDTWNTGFDEQVIRSAVEISRKFDVDQAHSQHVEELSRAIFAAIREEYKIDMKNEVLLRVAARMHETGMYLGTSGYHKHSMYIILNSELFGLSRRGLMLASLIARYHRRASPKPAHQGYAALSREERVLVRQLAAILRTADALDRSRSQRVRDISCRFGERRFTISVPRVTDLSVEQLAIKQKGPLFEEIFGTPVVLQPLRTRSR